MTFSRFAPAAAALAAALTAIGEPAVSFDPVRHSVSFAAVSTDCGMDVQLEFLLVGPDSDRDYESMFVTEAPVAEIAAAFAKAGIPVGRPYDMPGCRLWPVGVSLKMEPALLSLVREMRGDTTPPVIYTGGSRGPDGIPEAGTNMPAAVFAMYNCGQSLILLDDSLEQSPTYGRFQPAVKIPKGEKRTFTFTWSGTNDFAAVDMKLAPGKLAEAVALLKEKSKDVEIDVLSDFSPELTLAEAGEMATALSMVDSARVKINGVKKGQFFYRAFLPLEKWRDRSERLAQPPEVHFLPDGSFIVNEILEDWSDEESLDPKLTVKEHRFATAGEAAAFASSIVGKTFTMLLFAPSATRLERLFDFREKVKGDVLNWYVFKE